MRATYKVIFASLSAIALSGCMSSDIERAGAGAAAGAVGAAVLDGNIAGGILIGGLAGALCDDAGVCR